MKEKFSDRLRSVMKDKKITAAEISRRSGLSESLLSQYLNDKFEPKNDSISLIADALNVSPTFLMGWEEQTSESDIYGDHNANIEAFKNDPELLDFYMAMHNSDNLKLLFDTGRTLTPTELEKVLRYMKMVIEGDL